MAHKKGVGSSKNGRESESKRLGVKLSGGQAASQVTSSFAKEVQNTIQEKMSVLVKTILFLL